MGLKESGLRGSLRNVSVGIDAIPDSDVFDITFPMDEGSGDEFFDTFQDERATFDGASWESGNVRGDFFIAFDEDTAETDNKLDPTQDDGAGFGTWFVLNSTGGMITSLYDYNDGTGIELSNDSSEIYVRFREEESGGTIGVSPSGGVETGQLYFASVSYHEVNEDVAVYLWEHDTGDASDDFVGSDSTSDDRVVEVEETLEWGREGSDTGQIDGQIGATDLALTTDPSQSDWEQVYEQFAP